MRLAWFEGPLMVGFAFVVGAVLGRFLNVVIYRGPRGESVVFGGSRCPRCQAPIRPHHNIPILGWLLLRGRCRDCGEPISPQYPLVEAACGLAAAGLVAAVIAWLVLFTAAGKRAPFTEPAPMASSATATVAPPAPRQAVEWVIISLLVGLLAYGFWPGLLVAAGTWTTPQYSHGWLVPLFAIAVLAWRRVAVPPATTPERLGGLAIIAASLAIRLVAARYRIVTIDMYTLVPALLGTTLLAGGMQMLRWAGPPVAFLIFMYPLPDEATRYLLGPLQRLATMASTYALQTLGFEAFREGNQIVLGDSRLGVVDACSGLRMLTIFVALTVGWVLVDRVSWWERIAIVASAVPIAVAVNVARITATGMVVTVNEQLAEQVFHDWAGSLMMPLAVALLVIVRQLLAAVVIEETLAPVPVTDSQGRRPTGGP